MHLSLEELMKIEVISAAKKEEARFDAAAAIYVLTQEDLRRSGVTSIAEALRMVAGLQVARIDANKWAISARGFNAQFANKLLVLIDGRSVYTPLFGGVYWDVQDVLLEDVERIEVIRGPGGTLWGANAVNGVINILTKSARQTQGGYASVGAGTEEEVAASFRWGGRLGTDTFYRVYGKHFGHDDLARSSGDAAADSWQLARVGFRIDDGEPGGDGWSFQGNFYDGDAGQTLRIPSFSPPFATITDADIDVRGGSLLGRWRRVFSRASDLELQIYYDRTERLEETQFEETRDTFDLDFQHRFEASLSHELVWGLGYRVTEDEFVETFQASLSPDSRRDELISAFVQDQIRLAGGRLLLTLGSKFEENDYTGFEIQPNARILWKLSEEQRLWAAVSRAVQTPSRGEDDARFNFAALPVDGAVSLVAFLGSRERVSEDLLAFELGYRARPHHQLFLDLAAFRSFYDDSPTLEPGVPFFEETPAPSHLVVPLRPDNLASRDTYGLEAALNWNPTRRWKLAAGYSFLDIDAELDPSSQDRSILLSEGTSPEHQVHLRSYLDLSSHLELDTALYWVDKLPTLEVDSYLRLDLRLAWRHDALELSLGAENLLDSEHLEFREAQVGRLLASRVQRNLYARGRWRF